MTFTPENSFFVARTASMTPLRVAVRRVDDDDVDPGADERGGALVPVGSGPDGGADAEATLVVLDGLRVLVGLQDVLDRDEPDELARPSTTSSFSMRCL